SRSVADRSTKRRRPSSKATATNRLPRPQRSDSSLNDFENSGWLGSTTRMPGITRSTLEVLRHVRRPQDDHGPSRSSHASLRHRRDRQRKLALQEPPSRLILPADLYPRGSTGSDLQKWRRPRGLRG